MGSSDLSVRDWVVQFAHEHVIGLVVTLVVMVGAVLALTIVNSYLYTRNADQANSLTLVKQRQESDEKLIASQGKYIAAQRTAAQLAVQTQAAQAVAGCKTGIKVTHTANTIIRNLRGSLLDLADVVSRKVTKKILRERAASTHLFPMPHCSTVLPKPTKPKGRG